jgi:hypothetical protein
LIGFARRHSQLLMWAWKHALVLEMAKWRLDLSRVCDQKACQLLAVFWALSTLLLML